MISKENNFAFIDSQNLNLGVCAQGWELDFARFRVYLKDKYDIAKAFLCKDPDKDKTSSGHPFRS